LDVRDDIRRGREPFSKIMQAVATLAPAQDLMLLAPFEPTPLYGILAQQGFRHSAETTTEGDFKVRFSRTGADQAPVAKGSGASERRTVRAACDGVPVLDVDARGLEPPQPMVKILEAVATLPKGALLRAHTDRRPMHLYPQLEERGFAAESTEQSDGSFITLIRPRTTGS